MIKSHMHRLIYDIQYALATLSNSHYSPWIHITSPFKDSVFWLYSSLKV